jgi:hypothetical protein
MTHAARQLPDGWWTKDILHRMPLALALDIILYLMICGSIPEPVRGTGA